MTSATSDSTAATTSPVEMRSALTSAQQAVAGLGERREGLERLEGGGQPAAVALVVVALRAGVGGRGLDVVAGGGRVHAVAAGSP